MTTEYQSPSAAMAVVVRSPFYRSNAQRARAFCSLSIAKSPSSLGKSSITLRLVRSAWTHDYDPTIEDSYSVTRTIDGQTSHLSLTDTAGQEEYRSLWAAS